MSTFETTSTSVEPIAHVDVLIHALLEAANDKQDEVKVAVTKSLNKLGNQKPELMLEISHQYIQKHGKLTAVHRTIILRAVAEVCKTSLDQISPATAKEIVKLAVDEMTSSKDVIPEWQGAACAVLVALGQRFCYEVMESLHLRFQPGVVPHYFVVQTLGELSLANVFGMVPFLKAVLQTMLTIIATVKHDNMKYVFARALAHFSESIQEYIANIDSAPDPSVKKEVFSTELSVAYGVMFNSWMQSKEPKVRAVVIEAIGYITQIMSRDKLEEELPRLIPGMLAMYRRHAEPFVISQGLSMILESAISNSCVSVDVHLDAIFAQLFPQICALPDYTQQMNVKNHNEVLRCFAIIARAHSAKVITFLLQRVDNNNERIRIGSLTVLRHLINSSECYISDKIATVMTGLKTILSEKNNKVKKVFAHVIVALAHHGYLELDSSQAMVEFIIQQCALSDDPKGTKAPPDADFVSNQELRLMCENILHLLTTTVERMTTVFWPHILEFILPEHLTNAVGVVCKSATYLASKQKEEQTSDSEVDFEKHKNLPSPEHLITRLLVLLGNPDAGNGRGRHILKLMKVLVPNLEKNLMASWDSWIPKLLTFLEERNDSWSQKQWEQMVLKLLADSLGEVDRQDWTQMIGKCFAEQISIDLQYSKDKNFVFKCIGVVLRKTNSKTLVNELLDNVFKNVNHIITGDREGCASVVGYCAATHMDAVLVKLDQIARNDFGKKSGILSFIMDMKGELEHEIWKATIILCYGYVAAYSPIKLLTARIESPILRNVAPYFALAKDVTIRLSLIQMTTMVARSLHPANLRERISFRSKVELLKNMEAFIQYDKGVILTSPCCALAMDACTELLKLDPVIQCDDRLPLLRSCYDTVFPLPDPNSTRRSESTDEQDNYESLLQSTVDSMEGLLKEFLLCDVTANNFYSLFVTLEPWLMSSHTVERERAIHCVLILSKCFLDSLSVVMSGPNTFDSHGSMVARLVPRCTDPSPVVRERSLETIHTIMRASLRCEGYSLDFEDADIESVLHLKELATADDPDTLFNVASGLAKIISAKLSIIQLRQFLDVLMEGLVDLQEKCSSGTCVVLNWVLKSKAGALQQETETLIHLLHIRLAEITCAKSRKGTLQIIRTLAGFHLTTVLSCLLSYALPFDKHVSDWWRILAVDPQLSLSIIEQFCEILIRNPPYTEHPDPRNKKGIIRIATSKTLAVVSALREMFCIAEMETTARKEFHRLFTGLLSTVSCYVGVYPPTVIQESPKDPNAKPLIVINTVKTNRVEPARIAMEALYTFLLCTKCDQLMEDLSPSWDLLDNKEKNSEIVAAFAKSVAILHHSHLPGIVSCFNPMLSSVYDTQRIVAVAFFAELINHHSRLDQTALELLLNSMLGRLMDNSQVVRQLAIRGLGSIGKLDVENLDTLEWFGVYKYSNTVLSAMMSGMDDKDDPNGDITLESMKGLCRVLADMDDKHVEGILINIVLRVRSCFEKERPEIRAAAFTLFGMLCRFGKGDITESFQEQLHGNLICLLLHLNDEDKDVIKACKSALRSIGPLLGSEGVNSMFQKHLIDDSQLYYRDFIADLSKHLNVDFADKVPQYVSTCVAYFKSSWGIVKANAAMLAGFLLGNNCDRAATSATTFGALTTLLKDSSPDVRIKAAEAISLLHNY